MTIFKDKLTTDAECIWWAGVAAVAPERLIRQRVTLSQNILKVDNFEIDLGDVGRIAIVGAGKAAGAMAVAIENLLGPDLLRTKGVCGWVNVPADCVVPTQSVTLHAGRPAGVNEPRPEGVEGSKRILEIVQSLRPNDLCIGLITGGGSALLPLPVHGITLGDKIRLARLLSAAGANIEQLNMVRRNLSVMKGGGLARACRAGQLVSLIISDVPGDPPDLIASGPTVPRSPDPDEALYVLEATGLSDEPSIHRITEYLRREAKLLEPQGKTERLPRAPNFLDPKATSNVINIIVGNNAIAVNGAAEEARRLGYSVSSSSATTAEGPADEVGSELAQFAVRLRETMGPNCYISGGESTVTLIDESRRGKGGRNQQLALAALTHLGNCTGIVLLSGGTDGEDGPTDAAGAIVCEHIVTAAQNQQLNPLYYLRRNDAYHFFCKVKGLFSTGPTQTNVSDLRIVIVRR